MSSNAVAVLETGETQRFELMQREAKLFAQSPLIPQHLRQGGEVQALANCYIALKLARTMGEDPLVVLQNIHIVNGKAGFATQYMIARANAAGIFHGRIDWRIDTSDPRNPSVTAFAVLKDTGQEVSVTCDMRMAEAEGWTKNPKYKSMPLIMLRYRAAAFLVRFYAPDVMLGYQTSEEVEDVAIAAGPDLTAKPLTGAKLLEQAATPAPGDDAPEIEVADAIDEGRPTEAHGDQFTTEDVETADDLIARCARATVLVDVRAVEASLETARLPDALAGKVEDALEAARKRMGAK